MAYIMLPDLQVVLFFISPIVESFEKVFIHRFAMGYVLIYHTTIIPNTPDKMTNCVEFRIVES